MKDEMTIKRRTFLKMLGKTVAGLAILPALSTSGKKTPSCPESDSLQGVKVRVRWRPEIWPVTIAGKKYYPTDVNRRTMG